MADKKQNENDLAQMQMIQQNLQNILLQKQQFQMQLNEIDSALKELKETEKAFKIVGNLMIAAKKEDLEKDLNEKVKTIELRIKTFESQEEKFKKKLEDLQKKVADSMKQEK